jgi:rubrerythrin
MASFEQSDPVVEQFKLRRKRQIIAVAPLVAAMFGLFYTTENPDAVLLGLSPNQVAIAAGIVIVACLAFAWRNWRCPSCNGYLGKNWSPRFCPKCGVKLSGA